MATNEWGMLRDILNEVAAEHEKAAELIDLPFEETYEGARNDAEVATHLAIAHALRRVSKKMRTRAGMTPGELAAGIAEMFGNRAPRTTDKEQS